MKDEIKRTARKGEGNIRFIYVNGRKQKFAIYAQHVSIRKLSVLIGVKERTINGYRMYLLEIFGSIDSGSWFTETTGTSQEIQVLLFIVKSLGV